MGQIEGFSKKVPKLINFELCIFALPTNILISKDKVQVFAHKVLAVPYRKLELWGYS